MVVGIDLDNTACDTDDFYSSVGKFYFGVEPNLAVYPEYEKFGVSPEEIENFWSRCREMYICRAKPFKGFVPFVHKLQELGHKPVFISVRGGGADYTNTEIWLNKHNLDVPFFLCRNSDVKIKMCSQLGVDVMLDDTIEVYTACDGAGIKSFLHTAQYNVDAVVARRYDEYNDVFLRRLLDD